MHHTVSIMITQLCHCCVKEATANTQMDGHSSVLIKLCLSKQVANRQAVVCSLLLKIHRLNENAPKLIVEEAQKQSHLDRRVAEGFRNWQ